MDLEILYGGTVLLAIDFTKVNPCKFRQGMVMPSNAPKPLGSGTLQLDCLFQR